MPKVPNKEAVYQAAQQWKEKALLAQGSVFTDEKIWTKENLQGLIDYFVNSPIEGSDLNFYEKLEKQLSEAPASVSKFTAELMWVLALFVRGNISPGRKRQDIAKIWSWSGEELDVSHPLLSDDALQGIGRCGTAYLTKRWLEIEFVINLLQKLWAESDRAELFKSPELLNSWLDGVEGSQRRQFRPMIVHLLFPEDTEDSSSRKDYTEIISTYDEIPTKDVKKMPWSELNKRVAQIRKRLSGEKGGPEFSFYEFQEEWRSDPKSNLKSKRNKQTDSVMESDEDYDPISVEELLEVGTVSAKAKNQILFGPPGTGKTYNTINKSINIIDPDFKTKEDRRATVARFHELMAEGQIVFTTFHQSMNYEDFVEGIKPDSSGEELSYDVEDGIFKKLCQKAESNYKLATTQGEKRKPFDRVWEEFTAPLAEGETIVVPMAKSSFEIDLVTDKSIPFKKSTGTSEHSLSISTLRKMYAEGENKIIKGGLQGYYNYLLNELLELGQSDAHQGQEELKPYVLIIDEINRGNVAGIFGELITLLEGDKRIGAENELKAVLPYSKEEFSIPPNLYVIGTMNTADRSVEALDTALRRRFSFVEMMPQPGLLEEIEEDDTGEVVDCKQMLISINRRLEYLCGRDHTIGHAFFMKVQSIEDLQVVFQNKVIPQLQEYFYGDWSQIALVLGNGFVQKKADLQNIAWPKGLDEPDEELTLWEITNPEDWTAETFQSIYTDV